jgi:hypothetical protein
LDNKYYAGLVISFTEDHQVLSFAYLSDNIPQFINFRHAKDFISEATNFFLDKNDSKLEKYFHCIKGFLKFCEEWKIFNQKLVTFKE